jgi:chromosome segregation ATPase
MSTETKTRLLLANFPVDGKRPEPAPARPEPEPEPVIAPLPDDAPVIDRLKNQLAILEQQRRQYDELLTALGRANAEQRAFVEKSNAAHLARYRALAEEHAEAKKELAQAERAATSLEHSIATQERFVQSLGWPGVEQAMNALEGALQHSPATPAESNPRVVALRRDLLIARGKLHDAVRQGNEARSGLEISRKKLIELKGEQSDATG